MFENWRTIKPKKSGKPADNNKVKIYFMKHYSAISARDAFKYCVLSIGNDLMNDCDLYHGDKVSVSLSPIGNLKQIYIKKSIDGYTISKVGNSEKSNGKISFSLGDEYDWFNQKNSRPEILYHEIVDGGILINLN